MKIPRWSKLAAVIAIIGYAIYDMSREIAFAREYYRTNDFHWLTILIAASLIGIVCLTYRDKVSGHTKALQALIAVTILAAVITILATYLAVWTWKVRDMFQDATIRQKILLALFPFFFYGIAAGLWWQAIMLRMKHRTMPCTVRLAQGARRR